LYILIFSIWIGFISFFYPTASYYYSSFGFVPLSEGKGLEFLANKLDLSGKNIYTYRVVGLSAFLKPGITFNPTWPPLFIEDLPKNISAVFERDIDLVIFRQSAYFELSMTYALSFKRNPYTEVYNELTSSEKFEKIYSNPTTEIFVKK
jgi:hypothetical protein